MTYLLTLTSFLFNYIFLFPYIKYQERETSQEVRWTSALRRPERSGDRKRSGGPLLCDDRNGVETARGPVDLCSATTGTEWRPQEVRWTSALRRPERSGDRKRSGGPLPCDDRNGVETSNFEALWASFKQKEDILSDIFFLFKGSARRDSNPRPQPWQGCAPPTEPLAHFV